MSVALIKIGNVFHFRFQIDGRRVQRSTYERARHRAQAVAERAYRDAKLWARGDRLIPNLRELLSQWLQVNEATASSGHWKIVETFQRLHLYELGDMLIDELQTVHVEAARNQYLMTHSRASANKWLRVLKLVCYWAIRRKVIGALPFNVRTLKVQRKPRPMLSPAAASQWLAAVDQYGSQRMAVSVAVRLMLGLGLRESEAITARWEWLDAERRRYTPGITKGREASPIPVPDWLGSYLAPLRKPFGHLVTNPNGRIPPKGFTRRAMLHANRSCGLPHITPHRLRSTFATMLSESGAPVQTIQRVLRHKSPMTTMAYLEVDLDAIVLAQRLVADRFGFAVQPATSGEQVANEPQRSRHA